MTEDGKLDLEELKMMSSAMISNTMAAEVLRMDPGRLAEYARTGQLGWKVLAPEDGSRVYHNRKDFIRYWTGEPNNEQQERTVVQAIDDLREELHEIRLILMAQLSIGPLIRLDELKQNEKTAGAATPTD